MDFTVVIPSRNRPLLLRQAIGSVLAQRHPSVEVVVVDDGTDGDAEIQYRELEADLSERVRFLHLEKTRRGHGPSYAINRGVEAARGRYVCFLDDDDYWTDDAHLARAWASLTGSLPASDIQFANQSAFVGDQPGPQDLWLAVLVSYWARKHPADPQGTHPITVEELMTVADGRFAHLNTIIVRRDLYLSCEGMDENIRYECEWDLYLRLIASATGILYSPRVVARHNVPDPSRNANVSTAVTRLQKLHFRAYALDKAVLYSSNRAIRLMAGRHKTYTLKKMAEVLEWEGRLDAAYFVAREALIRPLDVKWRLYCASLAIRTLFNKPKGSS